MSDARDARDDDDDDARDDDDDDARDDARDARERRLARWRRATGRGGGVARGQGADDGGVRASMCFARARA